MLPLMIGKINAFIMFNLDDVIAISLFGGYHNYLHFST